LGERATSSNEKQADNRRTPLKNVTTLILCFALVLLGTTSWAQDDAKKSAEPNQPQETPESSDFDLTEQLESFDMVWDTIKRTHWDPDMVGETWDAAKEKFRPQVQQASDVAEVRQAINGLLNTLDQSHFGIIPGNEYQSVEDEDSEDGDGTVGMEIRLVEDQLVVTRVFPGYAAAEAGVQSGWIVKLVGKRTSDQLIETAVKVGQQSVIRKDTAVGLVCDARTQGPVGKKLAFAFIDNEDEVRLEYLEWSESPGEIEQFSNLPPVKVTFDSRELPEEVGYIAFNSFIGAPRLISSYNKAIKQYRDKQGLIIDLRGNRGGIVGLVSGMCGWLTDKKESLGKMSMSGGNEMNLVLNPRKPRFDKPVAVLTDSCSISAAEIMAGGIKDLKLGRVFGGTTAGLSLPSTVVQLPNGDRFQFAISAYHSASGESIEGTGVIPDQPVELTREMLQKSDDPVLDAAKKWILETNDK